MADTGWGDFTVIPGLLTNSIEWYRPHIEQWSKFAQYSTTLWFWNTEIGWANVHPVLAANGWEYVQAVHWDKGIGHVAGNVNGRTIRWFPVANEIVVFYQRVLEFETNDGPMHARAWLLKEWKRTGCPFAKLTRLAGLRMLLRLENTLTKVGSGIHRQPR